MNLPGYESDEEEEPLKSQYMSVAEVAKVLGKTEKEILAWLSRGMLPGLERNGEWQINRELFEGDRLSIDEFFNIDRD